MSRGGRKRKSGIKREPNGRASRMDLNREMEQHVMNSRARKTAITGRDDMPEDPLGILRGQGYITDAEYQEGRKFERLFVKVYGAPNAAGTAVFKQAVTPNVETITESRGEPMTDDAAKAILNRLILALDEWGRATRDAVINAVRYDRYPHNRKDLARLIAGLRALAGEFEPVKVVREDVKKAA